MRTLLTTCIVALSLLIACNDTNKNTKKEQIKDDFVKGADISWVTEMEKDGHKFYNSKGIETDCFALMKGLGMNAIRLRVWVNPCDHGDWCNTADLVVKARRAAALGMDVMVDFHYSDWWADPNKQYKPKSWEGLGLEELKAAFAKHTVNVLQALKTAGITPKWVQVGNEIRPGMLWDEDESLSCASYDVEQDGIKYRANCHNLGAFFSLGYKSVKSVFPSAKVIVHLDNGYDASMLNWFLTALRDNGGKWDMIGLSLYPYWAKEVQPDADKVITDCLNNITSLGASFDCDLMIVETGVECADDMGRLASDEVLAEGKRLMQRIVSESQTRSRCKGVFYWEPECKPGTYRLGAFTDDGRPTIIMDAFK